jgi:hypothetical protein
MPRLIRTIREALAEEPEDAEEADDGLDEDAEFGLGEETQPLSR